MPTIFIIIITLVFIVIGIDGMKYLVEDKIYWTRIKNGFAPRELLIKFKILDRISGIGYIATAVGIFSMFLGMFVNVNG